MRAEQHECLHLAFQGTVLLASCVCTRGQQANIWKV